MDMKRIKDGNQMRVNKIYTCDFGSTIIVQVLLEKKKWGNNTKLNFKILKSNSSFLEVNTTGHLYSSSIDRGEIFCWELNKKEEDELLVEIL
jgi:hypothetical protein